MCNWSVVQASVYRSTYINSHFHSFLLCAVKYELAVEAATEMGVSLSSTYVHGNRKQVVNEQTVVCWVCSNTGNMGNSTPTSH